MRGMTTPDWTSTKPWAGPDGPVTSTCWDCGATWRRGQDGSHSCVAHLQTVARALAEENSALKAVIERDGDIRRALPVLDAALKERDRLAEEVERLKAAAAFAPDRVLEAVKAGERARIRRELIAELEAWTKGAALSSFRASSLLAALNRICPGED